jgi:hypothetical protein
MAYWKYNKKPTNTNVDKIPSSKPFLVNDCAVIE